MIRREKAEKGRKGRGQIAAVFAAALLAASLLSQTASADTLAVSGGVVQGGSVTVLPPENVTLPDGVVYDLYQVAEAKPLEDSDGYTFDFGSFTAGQTSYDTNVNKEDASEVTAASLNAFAQDLAAAAQDGTIRPMAADYTGLALSGNTMVPAGLYLIILHGSEEGYWDTAKNGEIVTTAENGGKGGVFAPIVVSVPARGLAAQGEWEAGDLISYGTAEISSAADAGNTANASDNWQYNIRITAKAAEVEMYGSLRINKVLNTYATMEGKTDPGTFVFRVTARESEDPESAVLYTNVASVVLTAAGAAQGTTLDRIPVGSYVTVEEVYAGPNYTLAPAQMAVITADDPETEDVTEMAAVNFTNTYDDTGWSGGGFADNHFGAVETTGGWEWDNSSTTKTLADNSGTVTAPLISGTETNE